MTLPLVRGLQRGKLAPIAILTMIGLGLLAWRSPGNGQQPGFDEPIRAVSLARTSGPAEFAAGSTVFMISNSAHSTGAKGTNWWTDVEFHNPTTTMASYTMALLKRNTDNSSPQTVSFMLNPGSSQRYTDIINTVFGFNGAAAILVTVNSGSVIVTSVTYNRLGPGNPGNFPDGSTFGQYVPAFTDDQAITAGDQGRIIQLSHEPSLATAFRTNIGLVNAAVTPVAVTLNLYDKFGNSLGPAVPVNLRGLEFQQLDRVFEQFTQPGRRRRLRHRAHDDPRRALLRVRVGHRQPHRGSGVPPGVQGHRRNVAAHADADPDLAPGRHPDPDAHHPAHQRHRPDALPALDLGELRGVQLPAERSAARSPKPSWREARPTCTGPSRTWARSP